MLRIRRVAMVAVVLLAAACGTVPVRPTPPGVPRPQPVWVIDRGWHTEIGLAADQLDGPLDALRGRFPGARVLSFGFGDRHYLGARNPGSGDTLAAMLPDAGAMLVTGLAASPEAAFGAANVVELHLSDAGAERAAAYVWNSFDRLASGAPKELGEGPYPGSLFYAARITYSLLHTCNAWTADVLAVGGASLSADGVVLAGQVMDRARAAAK
jgi:uncharacterized protein (TIGR02117 family)